jgi:hypothetical protein
VFPIKTLSLSQLRIVGGQIVSIAYSLLQPETPLEHQGGYMHNAHLPANVWR